MLEIGLKLTLAYWLGGTMGGLLLARWRGAADIRTSGSGNPGATNALRAHGKWFALQVLCVDVGKGLLAVTVLPGLDIPGVGLDPGVDRSLLVYAVALAAIVGHVFPIWYGFRGGKGGATAAGLLCFLAPSLGAGILAVWVAVIVLTGFVGLATIAAAVAAAAYVGITGLPQDHALFVFACLVVLLIVYTHRGNIKRMRDGTESRFGRRFQAK